MSYKLFTLLYSVISVITLSDSYAQDFPALPEDVSFVNDMAGVLTIDQRDVLDIRLMEYYDSTRTIIMIVTINGFSGINPENYAAGLIVRWGVGNVYGEKALLMVVKPGNKSGPPFADIKPNQSMAGDID
ncbi:MAG: TPM domain-containing protein, partial [Bacteroidetes bacterium]|nr:TPM domain-containing protein [Bacteroidota bacterium]